MIKPKLVLLVYEKDYIDHTTLFINILHQDESLRKPPRILFKSPALHITTIGSPCFYGPDQSNRDWELRLIGGESRNKVIVFTPSDSAPLIDAYDVLKEAACYINLGIGARRRNSIAHRLLI